MLAACLTFLSWCTQLNLITIGLKFVHTQSIWASLRYLHRYSTYNMIKCCYCNSAVGVCRLNSAHFQKIIIFEISSCTIIEASKRKAKQESICMLWKLNKVKNFHKNLHDFLEKRDRGVETKCLIWQFFCEQINEWPLIFSLHCKRNWLNCFICILLLFVKYIPSWKIK